ncbi:hypothetical protein [Halorubrum vacuolatum]|uniref:Uncharacterized protein n=1 Tax=Halorubrum vacuolatum TaxID=63740 RepID=A0A238WA61_HALVU|nr:hypothetical protein [Halorubrum vacuolatum]SNR43466.1 hypothetical protein SAMN06264855_10698 [Halorubrum vacuolatum]
MTTSETRHARREGTSGRSVEASDGNGHGKQPADGPEKDGAGTDGSSETDRAEEGSGPHVAGYQWSTENRGFIAVFVALAAATVILSTGYGPLPAIDPSIPPAVYLYSTMGALGYAFTKLITKIGDLGTWATVDQLVAMALRVPAAWVLAAGVFLLANVLISGDATTDGRLIAGLSFLVGLYVNVAFESLGALADRLLAKGRS